MEFDNREFWSKVRRAAGKVPFIPEVVALYHCMLDVQTPFWVKMQIAGTLAYFISPVDAIADFIPGGHTDDAALVATTLAVIGSHLRPEHRARAVDWLNR